MNRKLLWYVNRLKKMDGAEVFKRSVEFASTIFSRFRYRNPAKWPYTEFAGSGKLQIRDLPGIAVNNDWHRFQIFNLYFDLTQPIDWHFSDRSHYRWPTCHHSKLDYRGGNPHGSVRINWELNRLQFLPTLAVVNETLSKNILKDWLKQNAYLRGPSYISAMEVAIRWISVYRAICLFKNPLDPILEKDLTGLARVSGKYIENHLSTHSSAGNHLIVEAVGLFWLGKAFEGDNIGRRWIEKSRTILEEQISIQINPDGSNKEQSFWYLGFVLDAIFHYLLLEELHKVPDGILHRVREAISFIREMVLPNGAFPKYGDCDDGFIFRSSGNYSEPFFLNLITVGNFFLKNPVDHRAEIQCKERLAFFKPINNTKRVHYDSSSKNNFTVDMPTIKTFEEGGITSMRREDGRILFRHAGLGLGDTCGHGHADALSILFDWKDTPVLVDLGSGQYDGGSEIRNFFRSTIAHNTVEIGGENQAKIIGPFLWNKSYNAHLVDKGLNPEMFAEATHDGYMKKHATLGNRRICYSTPTQFEIHDRFYGPGGTKIRVAFHLGECRDVLKKSNFIQAKFESFDFNIQIPNNFDSKIYSGSKEPFMGWRSTLYGAWIPCFSVIFSGSMTRDYQYKIKFNVIDKSGDYKS